MQDREGGIPLVSLSHFLGTDLLPLLRQFHCSNCKYKRAIILQSEVLWYTVLRTFVFLWRAEHARFVGGAWHRTGESHSTLSIFLPSHPITILTPAGPWIYSGRGVRLRQRMKFTWRFSFSLLRRLFSFLTRVVDHGTVFLCTVILQRRLDPSLTSVCLHLLQPLPRMLNKICSAF